MLASTLLFTAFAAQSGSSWTPAPSPTKESLRGLYAVSATVAWASGANATAMRTSDGGATWTKLSVTGADGLDFRDVHAWDARTAVLMSAGPGAKSRIYRTGNGGASWTLSHENKIEKGFFDSIAFWDGKHGVVVGDPVDGRFTILTTSDGGRSWQAVAGPAANEGEGAFAASGTAITVGKGGRAWFATGGEKGGRVFASTDWGRTWRAGAQAPIRHDSASAGIFSIAFTSKRGFAIGGDYRKTSEPAGSLVVSQDGGRSWAAATGLTGFRSAVAIDGSTIIATGPDGSDISRDGGKSWVPLEKPGYHALSIAGGRVWASGSEGRIAWMRLR